MISYKIIKSKPSTEFHGGEDRLSHRFPWLKTSFSPPDQERPGLAELFAAKRAAAKAQEKPKTVERLGKHGEVVGILGCDLIWFHEDLLETWSGFGQNLDVKPASLLQYFGAGISWNIRTWWSAGFFRRTTSGRGYGPEIGYTWCTLYPMYTPIECH